MLLRSHAQEVLSQAAFPRNSSDNLEFAHRKEHEASLARSPGLFSRIQIGLPQTLFHVLKLKKTTNSPNRFRTRDIDCLALTVHEREWVERGHDSRFPSLLFSLAMRGAVARVSAMTRGDPKLYP